MTQKTQLNNHLRKREIIARTEEVQSEIIKLQTLNGNKLENYYMNIKNLDEDALTMFWKPSQAAKNSQDGHDMIQSAVEGYKDVLESLTNGYNGVQAANDTFIDSNWVDLQDDLNEIVAGISTIARFTEYNGQVLINGEYASSTGKTNATFLVGVKPMDTVSFEPKNMSPSVLGKVPVTDDSVFDQDGNMLTEVYLNHFTKSGHNNSKVLINTTAVAQAALNSITSAISYVKSTLSDANLIQAELVRIKGFMNNKAAKGKSFLANFKNDRARELAQELEDLEGQLELLGTMGN